MLPSDPARRVVRFSDVCREIGLSPATLRRLCRDGRGPPLLQLSERRIGVRRGDLDAWVESLKKLGPKV
jgi:prophage regulatory protein